MRKKVMFNWLNSDPNCKCFFKTGICSYNSVSKVPVKKTDFVILPFLDYCFDYMFPFQNLMIILHDPATRQHALLQVQYSQCVSMRHTRALGLRV